MSVQKGLVNARHYFGGTKCIDMPSTVQKREGGGGLFGLGSEERETMERLVWHPVFGVLRPAKGLSVLMDCSSWENSHSRQSLLLWDHFGLCRRGISLVMCDLCA